jgi:hypothetical protein
MFPHNPNGPYGTSVAFLKSAAVQWLPTAARGQGGTYWGKHRAEEWGRRNGMAAYVSEEDFTPAVILLGVPIARHPDRGRVIGLRLIEDDTRSSEPCVQDFADTVPTVSRRRLDGVATTFATGGYPR